MFIKDYEDFKVEIYKMTNINLTLYKERQMKRRIESLVAKNNFENFNDYVLALKKDTVLYNEFINYITINVSEFFRNPEQWQILKDDILPMLLEKNKNIKIWSAACSTGDEPYTLVMTLRNFLPYSSIKILASDIDKEVLAKAQVGIYNERSLTNCPKEEVKKFFTQEGEFYKIKDEVKNCVQFIQHNLLKDPYPPDCDLIICRNVLIYFTEEAKTDIYTKFNRALKNDGVLFVGSTEQIISAHRFNFAPIKTFFYQKKTERT